MEPFIGLIERYHTTPTAEKTNFLNKRKETNWLGLIPFATRLKAGPAAATQQPLT